LFFKGLINKLSVSDAHLRIRPWNPTRATSGRFCHASSMPPLSGLLSRRRRDLEQEAIPHLHARKEIRGQRQHEPLALLRLDLRLALRRVKRRHSRPHCAFRWITDFDILAAHGWDGHRDYPATLIPHMVRGGTLLCIPRI